MRQLPYGNSTTPIRLAFPPEWDPTLVSGVTLTIDDRDGAELAAAADSTLWSNTTLDGAVIRFASSLVLTVSASRAVFRSATTVAATYAALTDTGKLKITEHGETGVDINPDATAVTTMTELCAAIEAAMSGVVAGYTCSLDYVGRPAIYSDQTGDAADSVTISSPDDGIDLTGALYLGAGTSVAGGNTLQSGDAIKILGASGDEIQRVKGWKASTSTAEIEGILENAHDDSAEVFGLFSDVTVDLSDTAVYTAGIVVRLVWTPTGDGQPITELAQVSVSALDIAGIRQDVADIYPRVYKTYTIPVDKFDRMVKHAERKVQNSLGHNLIDAQRVVDQDRIKDYVVAMMAYVWSLSGDIDKEDERKVINSELERCHTLIVNDPFWQDHNQDGVEDEVEVSSYDPSSIEERSW